jgi:hypothetical protein
MNRKRIILLMLVLSLFAGCAASPSGEEIPPVDGQSKDVVAVIDSQFAVDKDGNTYYCDDRAMMRRDINGQEVKLADGYVSVIVHDDRIYYQNYFYQVVTMKTDGSHKRVLASRNMDFDMMLVGHSIFLIDDASNTAILRMDTNGLNL